MPIHLTKQKVEELLASLSASCRHEMEVALDTQLELSSGCKHEIQAALSDVPGVNPSEGTSKRMKMTNQPPLSDGASAFGVENSSALDAMFDITVVLTAILAGILTIFLLLRKGSFFGGGAKKLSGELSTRKLLVKSARRR